MAGISSKNSNGGGSTGALFSGRAVADEDYKRCEKVIYEWCHSSHSLTLCCSAVAAADDNADCLASSAHRWSGISQRTSGREGGMMGCIGVRWSKWLSTSQPTSQPTSPPLNTLSLTLTFSSSALSYLREPVVVVGSVRVRGVEETEFSVMHFLFTNLFLETRAMFSNETSSFFNDALRERERERGGVGDEGYGEEGKSWIIETRLVGSHACKHTWIHSSK